MLTLRADPWMPEYGMGFDVRFDEPPATVEPFVESEDWSVPRAPEVPEPIAVHFVDGVRRIDLRLLADQDGRRAPGLFGTHAVGVARCAERAELGEGEVGRVVVLGGGLVPAPVEIDCGSSFVYAPVSEPDAEPDAPLLRLQRLMRDAEANVAARVAAAGAALVLADGPLAFFGPTPCPVVGIVKRFGRVYLEPEQGALLPRLLAGQRTPLFAIESERSRVRRYAWYARLVAVRAPWHDHAGIVRCEIRGGVALSEAARIADTVSALLPAYAGRPIDPRSPQNLAPVAGLETWLRHRMGDPRLVRRALLEWIANTAVAA